MLRSATRHWSSASLGLGVCSRGFATAPEPAAGLTVSADARARLTNITEPRPPPWRRPAAVSREPLINGFPAVDMALHPAVDG